MGQSPFGKSKGVARLLLMRTSVIRLLLEQEMGNIPMLHQVAQSNSGFNGHYRISMGKMLPISFGGV